MAAVQEYLAPQTLDEALAILAERAEGTKILAGGTDLVVRLREGHLKARRLVSLKNLAELEDLALLPDGTLRIGALTRVSALETSPLVTGPYPALVEAALSHGSPQIRNLATVAGNVANASPAADLSYPLIALGATIVLRSTAGERAMPLEDFFTGPGRTVLDPTELVTHFLLPPPPPHSAQYFRKFSNRNALSICFVGLTILLTADAAHQRCQDARISLGAVAPTCRRAPAAEALLRGHPITPALAQQAADAAVSEVSPINDVRASAGFRLDLVRTMVAQGVLAAWERIEG